MYEDGYRLFYEYEYGMLKSSILAYCIYEMYKKDPTETLKKVDLFLENLNILSEDKLLNIFKLDNSIF